MSVVYVRPSDLVSRERLIETINDAIDALDQIAESPWGNDAIGPVRCARRHRDELIARFGPAGAENP